MYDLKGVSRSQITSDTFEMIKVGNQVMSSFPETLHCLLIINAPRYVCFILYIAVKNRSVDSCKLGSSSAILMCRTIAGLA